jgi:hypothetical protein
MKNEIDNAVIASYLADIIKLAFDITNSRENGFVFAGYRAHVNALNVEFTTDKIDFLPENDYCIYLDGENAIAELAVMKNKLKRMKEAQNG